MTRLRLLLLAVSALCAANAAAQQAFVGASRSFPPPDFDPTIRVGNTVAVNVSWFNVFACLPPTGCFPVKFQVSAPDSELVSLFGQYDQCGSFSDGPVAPTSDGFGYFVRYATPGIKTVSVTVIRCDASLNPTGQVVSNPSASFEVFCPQGGCAPPPPPPPQQLLRIQAAIGTATLEPAQGVTSPQSAPVNAHFPLGSSFRIAAFDANGNPTNMTFTLQAAAVEAGVEPGALFPALVALQYTNAQPNEANFQAVHRGTVALSIVPADPNIQPALLNLVVENPQGLGTTNSQFDAIIQDLSHSRGVLPQYIKAIAHHESVGTFDGLSYRYEPIGPSTGDLDVISHGLDLRTQTPYSEYRIATADYYGPADPPLAAGPNLLPDDVNPRSLYFITRVDCLIPGSTLLVRRQIRPCDHFVGADEIYFDNPAAELEPRSSGAPGTSKPYPVSLYCADRTCQ